MNNGSTGKRERARVRARSHQVAYGVYVKLKFKMQVEKHIGVGTGMENALLTHCSAKRQRMLTNPQTRKCRAISYINIVEYS